MDLDTAIAQMIGRRIRNQEHNVSTLKNPTPTLKEKAAEAFAADQASLAAKKRSDNARRAAATRAQQRAAIGISAPQKSVSATKARTKTAAPEPAAAEPAFYVVWNEASSVPPTKKFVSEAQAFHVAEDMCKKKGEPFHVLVAVGTVAPPPTVPQTITKRFI